jgi:hypothetical protein
MCFINRKDQRGAPKSSGATHFQKVPSEGVCEYLSNPIGARKVLAGYSQYRERWISEKVFHGREKRLPLRRIENALKLIALKEIFEGGDKGNARIVVGGVHPSPVVALGLTSDRIDALEADLHGKVGDVESIFGGSHLNVVIAKG